MRLKTLLGLSFLGSCCLAGCGLAARIPPNPLRSSHRHVRQRLLRRDQPPARPNQPMLRDRLGNRQLQSQRDLVRSLRNHLKLWPLHRPIHCAHVRFR